jgi:hypothetical protein
LSIKVLLPDQTALDLATGVRNPSKSEFAKFAFMSKPASHRLSCLNSKPAFGLAEDHIVRIP